MYLLLLWWWNVTAIKQWGNGRQVVFFCRTVQHWEQQYYVVVLFIRAWDQITSHTEWTTTQPLRLFKRALVLIFLVVVPYTSFQISPKILPRVRWNVKGTFWKKPNTNTISRYICFFACFRITWSPWSKSWVHKTWRRSLSTLRWGTAGAE